MAILLRCYCTHAWSRLLQFTKIDGGYTATDYVLRRLLQETTCTWLSVTNGDNIYGSEVVQRVLRHHLGSGGGSGSGVQRNARSKGPAQMLLAPLDSRNFAALGTLALGVSQL
jgi:hypothetical protein